MSITFAIKIELYHTVSCWIAYDQLNFTQFTEKRKPTSNVDVMYLVLVTTYHPEGSILKVLVQT